MRSKRPAVPNRRWSRSTSPPPPRTVSSTWRMPGGEFPHLDGLLHNASVLGERRPIESASYAGWQDVMQVNVNAQFLLTRHMLPLLQAAPAASIIFTSSGVGRTGKPVGRLRGVQVCHRGLYAGAGQRTGKHLPRAGKQPQPGGDQHRHAPHGIPAERPTDNPAPEDIMASYLF